MDSDPFTRLWQDQIMTEYNYFSWVDSTKCEDKKKYNSLNDALQVSNHTKFQMGDDSIGSAYLCPHCGFYHRTKKHHRFRANNYLVFGSGKVPRLLSNVAYSDPLSQRTKKIWDGRKFGKHDEIAAALFDMSQYREQNCSSDDRIWYDTLHTPVILPLESSVFYLLKKSIEGIIGFLQIMPEQVLNGNQPVNLK